MLWWYFYGLIFVTFIISMMLCNCVREIEEPKMDVCSLIETRLENDNIGEKELNYQGMEIGGEGISEVGGVNGEKGTVMEFKMGQRRRRRRGYRIRNVFK